MRKLFLLSAILIAVIISSCSSDDYKTYVPADSKVVAKIDVASFFSQMGVDQEQLFKALGENYGDDLKDIKSLGIDFATPMYFFARPDGQSIEFGAVVKVQDRAQLEKTFESKTGLKLSKGQGYSYAVDNGVSAAVNDEAMVFQLKVDQGSGKIDKSSIDRVMNKKIEGDLAGNNVFAKVDDNDSFASFCADLSIIPESMIPQGNDVSQKDIKQLRSMVINIDASARDGVCDFLYSATSTDKDMQAKIDKYNDSMGFISEKALGSFSSSDLFGFATNINGEAVKDVLTELIGRGSSLIPLANNSEDINQIYALVNKLSDIISNIKGNVVCSAHSISDYMFLAEGKNITDDVVGIMKDAGVSPTTLMKTENGYSMGGSIMFGYQDNYFYVTTNQANIVQPTKAMGDPAPEALMSLMKDRKFVAFGNVKAIMQFANQAGGDSSDLKVFAEIFNKINYITYSYK